MVYEIELNGRTVSVYLEESFLSVLLRVHEVFPNASVRAFKAKPPIREAA
jgi:hypothetical protein